jgi:hypothetical protein
MRRWVAVLLLITALAAAGCRAKPAGQPADTAPAPPSHAAGTDPAPPPPQGQPAQGQAVQLDRITVFREGPGNRPVLSGINEVTVTPGGEVAVGSGYVMVTWWGEIPASVVVKTSGYNYESLNAGTVAVQAMFPAGGPERWEAWLDGVEGSKVTLVHKPEPTVQVSFRAGDGPLAPVAGSDLAVAQGPVTLDFQFDQPMKPDSLSKVLGESPLTGSWVAPDHATATLAAVPDKLLLDLGWFQAATGLLAPPRALMIRSAAGAPYLEKVNVLTGATERIMDLPPEISSAQLSPGAKFLAFQAYEPGTEQYAMWPSYMAVADLTARRASNVEAGWWPAGWKNEHILVTHMVPGWAFWDAAAGSLAGPAHTVQAFPGQISPDGRFGADLVHPKEAPQEGLVPEDLVITDLQTDQPVATVQGFMNQFYVGKDGIDLSLWVTWSPDGQRVAGLDSLGWQSGKSDLVVYDRGTGKRTVVAAGLPVGAFARRLYWSPDGRSILAAVENGRAYLIPVDGSRDLTTVHGGINRPMWDATGGRFLSADTEWGQVFAFMVNKGARVDLGKGFPAGWDGDWAYIIRWPKSDTRYIYQGI